ncbi:MAG: hypothetical protein JO329_03215 [Planctomycetaceae bacterium]|nr:hypothetical protein [Planctomycetaceae bacterium]MBV8266309.1 hypothetical protein [Planctomycetaceae bacterium]MBV8317180.1 hypothetical protein [Planctomycetaceae bacterium]MBV8381678.1 hypothetical protein [Planctomycetaceae bacterium]
MLGGAHPTELGRIRDLWGNENGRLGVRDGTLGEDAGALQNGSAPEVIAIRRTIPIVVFQCLGRKDATAATRRDVCPPDKSLEIASI